MVVSYPCSFVCGGGVALLLIVRMLVCVWWWFYCVRCVCVCVFPRDICISWFSCPSKFTSCPDRARHRPVAATETWCGPPLAHQTTTTTTQQQQLYYQCQHQHYYSLSCPIRPCATASKSVPTLIVLDHPYHQTTIQWGYRYRLDTQRREANYPRVLFWTGRGPRRSNPSKSCLRPPSNFRERGGGEKSCRLNREERIGKEYIIIWNRIDSMV
jgi:hypothetical protein